MVLPESVRHCRAEAVLADEGWLTDMRTAAAGALAAKAALSRSGSSAVRRCRLTLSKPC
jgi:ornithine cyclodeaminase/alanine dehydrogenase-like protein (mu-crystallin family)